MKRNERPSTVVSWRGRMTLSWRSLDVEWSGCVSLVAREGEVAAAGELCRGETREQ